MLFGSGSCRARAGGGVPGRGRGAARGREHCDFQRPSNGGRRAGARAVPRRGASEGARAGSAAGRNRIGALAAIAPERRGPAPFATLAACPSKRPARRAAPRPHGAAPRPDSRGRGGGRSGKRPPPAESRGWRRAGAAPAPWRACKGRASGHAQHAAAPRRRRAAAPLPSAGPSAARARGRAASSPGPAAGGRRCAAGPRGKRSRGVDRRRGTPFAAASPPCAVLGARQQATGGSRARRGTEGEPGGGGRATRVRAGTQRCAARRGAQRGARRPLPGMPARAGRDDDVPHPASSGRLRDVVFLQAGAGEGHKGVPGRRMELTLPPLLRPRPRQRHCCIGTGPPPAAAAPAIACCCCCCRCCCCCAAACCCCCCCCCCC
jgi:hypothetical protein